MIEGLQVMGPDLFKGKMVIGYTSYGDWVFGITPLHPLNICIIFEQKDGLTS